MLNILKMAASVFKLIWKLIQIPLFLFGILVAAFLIALAIAVVIGLIQGKRFKKGEN